MSDAGSDWISRFLTEEAGIGRRCVVIGGTEELFAFLLFSEYAVAHIDQEQGELDNIRNILVDDMISSSLEGFEQYCIDVENDGSFAWRADDILILIRSVHHLQNPSEFLNRICKILSKGTIYIVDWTIELFQRQLSEKEDGRRNLRTLLNPYPDVLEEEQKKWAEYDRIDSECLGMIEKFQWHSKEQIITLMHTAGLDDASILYALPCPCTDYSCRKLTTYWFCVWSKGEQCEKALNAHALQKMISRSSFD